MVNISQFFLIAVIAIALVQVVRMLSAESPLENFSAVTQDLSSYQERAFPVGNSQVAILTSPGSGISGYGLLSVGHAHRSVGTDHFGFSIKAALPLAEGGPVRFVYTEPARFLEGKYFVYLENASGEQMQIPGEVERLQDGSSRLYYFKKGSPAKYAGYDQVIVKYLREDEQQATVLSGTFA